MKNEQRLVGLLRKIDNLLAECLEGRALTLDINECREAIKKELEASNAD